MKKSLTIRGLIGYIIVSVICGVLPFPVSAARTVVFATLNGLLSVVVAPSAFITAQLAVTTSGSGSNNDWESTYWQVGNEVSGCVDHSDHTNPGTFSESFTITAPSSPGTYSVSFVAYKDDGCSQDGSLTFTMTNSVTVIGPSSSPTPPIPTPSPSPSPTPTPTPFPTPTPTPIDYEISTCDETWDVTFEQTSGSAVRNGQVGFKVTLPGLSYGRMKNNPSIYHAYQYPDDTFVTDPEMVITSFDSPDPGYEGVIYMKSADVVLVKFDLWCMDTGDSFTVFKTFYWPLPTSVAPTPTPTPTGSVSDIRYVDFEMVLDVDSASSSDGLILNSQVQLRNLKENL